METVQNIPKIHHLGLPMDQEIAINVSRSSFSKSSNSPPPVTDASPVFSVLSASGERSTRLSTSSFVRFAFLSSLGFRLDRPN